jgi:Spy/CpxP family protein refolding chaperone
MDFSLIDGEDRNLASVLAPPDLHQPTLTGMSWVSFFNATYKEFIMKFTKSLAFSAAGLVLAGTALAQPYGMGPDMMGGYGMGGGMMGSYGGGYRMGQGGMRGGPDGGLARLNLSPDQSKKIANIQATSSRAMWQLMGAMHEQGYQMQGMYGPGSLDEPAARKSFQAMTESRQAMFDLQLDTRKKIDNVLTKEQREQLAHNANAR